MKIIGAGLSRTATLTQKAALEILGFPCYHMFDVMVDTHRMTQWVSAVNGKPDWDALFDGFSAVVDISGWYFYRDLIEYYPDAKVLLSVRDADSWARSVRSTLWNLMAADSVAHHLWLAQALIDENPVRHQFAETMAGVLQEYGVFGPDPRNFDAKAATECMERHNAEVRRIVPRERLLEWRPADGWQPLCEFLQVPVPEMPLPRVNDSATFGDLAVDLSLDALNKWHAGSR